MLEAFPKKSFAAYSHLGWGTKQLHGDLMVGWAGLDNLRVIDGGLAWAVCWRILVSDV